MKVSFIHTGDLHLGRQFHFRKNGDVFGSNKRTDLWLTFEKIINTAEKNSIDLLLISGDLFDADEMEIAEINRAADRFSKLSRTKVVIIAGNHDYYSSLSLYGLVDWPANVTILKSGKMESVYFPSLKTEVYGLSWVKNAYGEIPYKGHLDLEDGTNNIMMLHGDAHAVDGSYMPIDPDNYDYFDYVALGHRHKSEFITKRMAYCGSPEALDFEETGEHGMIVGQIENHRCTTQFVPTQIREYVTKTVELTPEMPVDTVIDTIVAIDEQEKRLQNYYRVILTGYVDESLSMTWVRNELQHYFYYLEIDDTGLEVDLDVDGILADNQNNIIGQFIQEMRRHSDDPIGILKEGNNQ